MFERRIIKLGPSRAIILGKQLCEYFGLEAGDTVEIEGLRKVPEDKVKKESKGGKENGIKRIMGHQG